MGKLEAGNYVIMVDCYWEGKTNKSFTVNNYSDIEVHFKEVKCD